MNIHIRYGWASYAIATTRPALTLQPPTSMPMMLGSADLSWGTLASRRGKSVLVSRTLGFKKIGQRTNSFAVHVDAKLFVSYERQLAHCIEINFSFVALPAHQKMPSVGGFQSETLNLADRNVNGDIFPDESDKVPKKLRKLPLKNLFKKSRSSSHTRGRLFGRDLCDLCPNEVLSPPLMVCIHYLRCLFRYNFFNVRFIRQCFSRLAATDNHQLRRL